MKNAERVRVWDRGEWRNGNTTWPDNDGTYLVTADDGVETDACMGDIETLKCSKRVQSL